jgi:putative SOS response-associated peptidase YedK
MCGRYTLALPAIDIALLLDLMTPDFDFEPRYNVAPTQRLPVLSNDAPDRLSSFRWGLIPSWAKDPSIGNQLINARAETLAEKPAFRQALAQRRCLIPATGFYEWKAGPVGKVPQHIHMASGALLTFAGLWESWRDGEGREIRSFTIITTRPNALMAPIHDRMPVIIAPQDRLRWLQGGGIADLLQPYPDGELVADPVCHAVNSPRNEGPALLDPPAPSLF